LPKFHFKNAEIEEVRTLLRFLGEGPGAGPFWSPETRMHTLWRGPMRVVSHNFAEYTLLDLVTGKEKWYHMTQLKPFRFDPTHVDPTDIARRDYLEFLIEDILDMKGNIRAYKSLTFHVKWLNYTYEHNTWEPWTHMRVVRGTKVRVWPCGPFFLFEVRLFLIIPCKTPF
jgi:hypothetical protein